jgi:hypothetical protein
MSAATDDDSISIAISRVIRPSPLRVVFFSQARP